MFKVGDRVVINFTAANKYNNDHDKVTYVALVTSCNECDRCDAHQRLSFTMGSSNNCCCKAVRKI